MQTSAPANPANRSHFERLCRFVLALVIPPSVTLTFVIAGIGVERLLFGPVGALIALLLIGPVAIVAGSTLVVALWRILFSGSRLRMWLAIAVNLAVVYLVWSFAWRFFVTSWR